MEIQNREKENVIIDRLMQIIQDLPYKQANLLAYVLEPNTTAIGADFYYNRDQVRSHLTDSLSSHIAHLDGNGQYTLNQVYDMITKGEI